MPDWRKNIRHKLGVRWMSDTMKPIYEIAENSNSEKVGNVLSARFEKIYDVSATMSIN